MDRVIPLNVFADMLRLLDEETLEDLFELLLVEYDSASLSEKERKAIKKAEVDYEKGNVVVKSLSEL